MAKIALKNIVGKNKELTPVLQEWILDSGNGLWVEDGNGQVLLGQPGEARHSFPVESDGETLGWAKGGEKAALLARLLGQLLQKESEKKKLGSEVLSLYHEINVIFNFSEKLTQTIEPDVIARLALEETVHSISPDSGTILLWDADTNQLQIPSLLGAPLFDREALRQHVGLLLKIGLSGQSEIINDLSLLKEKNIIDPSVQSLMYAAMKVKHRIMGAMILAGRNPDQFSAANLKLLVTLALQSSAAIESAMLYEKNIREVEAREEAILRIHEVTKKFVPHEFIRSLGKEQLTDVRLGDQSEKIVTVLFTDIRDFTTLSERMTPEENFRFVSSFNARLGPIIRARRGFINQYLGDSIMAIFPENADDALHAAIDMQKEVSLLNEERSRENLPPIRAGIGMHTGPLIMGITGDEHRMDAATISDTVNTAARIESLTKYYKSPLLLSDETLQRISDPDSFGIRHLGGVKLSGKNKALNIVECFDGYTADSRKRKWDTLPVFNQAMERYRSRHFGQAIALFESILATDPEDQTTRHFIEKSAKYLLEGTPENWTGAEEMISK